MKKFFEEFKAFAVKGNAMDLAVGMMVGAAVGMAAKSMMKPKKRKLAKSASKAIGAVGETMQNISSYLK